MKLNKIFLPLVAAAAFIAPACTDEVEYTPASPTGTNEVYFPNNQPAEIKLAQDAAQFTVTLARVLDADNLSVTIESSSADAEGASAQDIFKPAATVEFAAGAKEVAVPVSVDFSKVIADTEYTVSLSISGSETTPYGDSSITVTVSYAPWSEYELYSQDPVVGIMGSPWTGEAINGLAYYRYSMINSNLEQYIIQGPRYSNLHFDYELSLDKTQTYDIDGTTCYKVTMPLTDTYYDNGDQRIMYMDAFSWMRAYGAKDGASMSDEQIEKIMAGNGFGRSYYNPETGVFSLWLVPCVKGEELRRFSQSYTYINLPGFKQYSVEFSYAGNFVGSDGEEMAIISALKSDDVTSYKYEIVSGKLNDADLAAAYTALEGNSDAEVVEDATYTILYTPEEAGWYTVVAVGYDDTTVACHASFSFEFDSVQKESDWVSIGYAEYTDDILTSALQNWTKNYTWDVEVEESKSTPGLYRLVNPYQDLAEAMPNSGLHQMTGKYYMVIDATVADEVFIDLSNVGLDFNDDDPMIVYSLAANYLAAGNSREDIKKAGYFGTLKDGVISFPAKTLLVSWSSLLPNLGYANENGKFFLDLNATDAAKAPAKFAAKAGKVSKAYNPEVKTTYERKASRKLSAMDIAGYNFMKPQMDRY